MGSKLEQLSQETTQSLRKHLGSSLPSAILFRWKEVLPVTTRHSWPGSLGLSAGLSRPGTLGKLVTTRTVGQRNLKPLWEARLPVWD
jgi:hypothetical protein